MRSKNLPLDDTNDITLNQSYTASKANVEVLRYLCRRPNIIEIQFYSIMRQKYNLI